MAVVPDGAGLGGEHLGGDTLDTKSSEVTRRVTDEDTPHGNGKAHGRVRFGTKTAAVVAAIQAVFSSSIRYSRLFTARSTLTGISGDPVHVLRPVITLHHVSRASLRKWLMPRPEF